MVLNNKNKLSDNDEEGKSHKKLKVENKKVEEEEEEEEDYGEDEDDEEEEDFEENEEDEEGEEDIEGEKPEDDSLSSEWPDEIELYVVRDEVAEKGVGLNGWLVKEVEENFEAEEPDDFIENCIYIQTVGKHPTNDLMAKIKKVEYYCLVKLSLSTKEPEKGDARIEVRTNEYEPRRGSLMMEVEKWNWITKIEIITAEKSQELLEFISNEM